MKHHGIGNERVDTPSTEKVVEDPLSTRSNRSGLLGFIESCFRKFRTLGFLLFLSPLVILYIVIIGLALSPGIYFFYLAQDLSQSWPLGGQVLITGVALSTGLICFWLSLLVLVPFFNLPFLPFVKPQRGTWFSLNVIPWYYHNALMQLARYMLLDYITPTPLNVLFFRLMGMKVGKGVVINTSNISDPCLIRLDDFVTIGGSATLFGHYGMKGYLIIGSVHIKRGTTIGLKASVMGDVVVGENVMVKPHAVLLPKTRVEDNAVID